MRTHIGVGDRVFDLREVVHMEATTISHRDNSSQPYRLVPGVTIHLRTGLQFSIVADWSIMRKEWIEFMKERAEEEAKPKELRIRFQDWLQIQTVGPVQINGR